MEAGNDNPTAQRGTLQALASSETGCLWPTCQQFQTLIRGSTDTCRKVQAARSSPGGLSAFGMQESNLICYSMYCQEDSKKFVRHTSDIY